MRIASFLRPFEDEQHAIGMECCVAEWVPPLGQEDIGTGPGIGKPGAKDREIFLKVVNDVGGIYGQIKAKGIDLVFTLIDFELFALEGQPPMRRILPILIEIALQLHFPDVALPQGNTQEEPEHEGATMLSRPVQPWVFFVRAMRGKRFMGILQLTQGDPFEVIAAEGRWRLLCIGFGGRSVRR